MSRVASHVLLGCVLLLIGLGVVMLISTGVWSADQGSDHFFSLRRQLAWLGLGVLGCVLASRIPFSWLQRLAPALYVLSCLLLALCFVPEIGVTKNGSSRWIGLKAVGLSSVQVQPSECAKLALVLGLAAWYARAGVRSRGFLYGYGIPMLLVAVPVALVGCEVDLGAAALIGLAAFALMFVAGANLGALGATVLAGLAAIAAAVTYIPNRAKRFTEFLDVLRDPMAHLTDTGMQQVRAMMAFASGSTSGVGLGAGKQKVLGLPYAHTDFIFPMIGEELGLVATLAVVVCYALILIFGMFIALHAATRFGRLVGVGCVVLLALQATLNIAVTTVCLPNKGLPLPFVSYGGSNLLFCLVCVGLLINLHRQAVFPESERARGVPRQRLTPRA
ncbi:MAG: FtsW/RodA/SpoVE family cell cycle protein [Verrucomicrobiales bacterium]